MLSLSRDTDIERANDERGEDRGRGAAWAAGVAVFALAAVFSLLAERSERSHEIESAQREAQQTITKVIQKQLTSSEVAGVLALERAQQLTDTLTDHVIGASGDVVRVRIWAWKETPASGGDGVSRLVLSTDASDRPGGRSSSESEVGLATSGVSTSGRVTEEIGGNAADLLRTFVPLKVDDQPNGSFGAIEVEHDYASLTEASRDPWAAAEYLFSALALVCVLPAIAGLRGPRAAKPDAAPEAEVSAIPAVRAAAEALRNRPPEVPQAPPALVLVPAGDEPRPDRPAPQPESRPEPDSSAVQEELETTREQLRRTKDAYRFLEERLQQLEARLKSKEAIKESSGGAEQRVTQLQDALRSSEAELQRVRDALTASEAELLRARERGDQAPAPAPEREPAPEPELPPGVEELRELREALRRSEAERALLQAGQRESAWESRAAELETELAAERERVVELEQRVEEQIRAAASTTAEAEARVVAALSEAEPTERRAAEAERRASDAEAKIDKAERSAKEADRRAATAEAALEKLRRASTETAKRAEAGRPRRSRTRPDDADAAPAAAARDPSIRLARRRTNLEALVARAVAKAPKLEDRTVKVHAESVSVPADAHRLEQVLEALLANARTRTSPGETITVMVQPAQGGAVVSVDDQGGTAPVIGEELTSASQLVAMHGGRLWAESNEGGGSYRIFLPSMTGTRAAGV